MNVLEVLQTIGICVGALALVAIAVMMFLVISSFLPSTPQDLPTEEEINAALEDQRGRPSRRKQSRSSKASNNADKV